MTFNQAVQIMREPINMHSKRDEKRAARITEREAVAMYLNGKTLKQIKRKTTVAGFIVRGLVTAHCFTQITR